MDFAYVDLIDVDLADVAFDDMDPCDLEPSVICTPPNFATSYPLTHNLIN